MIRMLDKITALACSFVFLISCNRQESTTLYRVENENIPEFEAYELTTEAYEEYSDLDYLGRCGAAEACVGVELMPTEERGNIGMIKPSGWQTIKYDFVDGKYLYNRCHLIGYQLSGENDNEKNLITGTRSFNAEGMLPFENEVAEYVKKTKNHVMYRVTPIFEGENLVADGVTMEAYSVEDNGRGVCFNVYVYNTQPGVIIDYATGKAELAELKGVEGNYVLNTKTKKFHTPSCKSVADIKENNKEDFTGKRQQLIIMGYAPCGACNP